MVFERIGRVFCAFALAALPLLAGCGGGGQDPPASPPGPPPVSPPVSPPPQNTVGPAGGTVKSAEGAEVSVPPGALSHEVAIAVAAAPSGAPALPAGLLALGAVFAFTPHGTTFALPGTVSVPFDAAQLPAGETPVLYKADGAGAAAGEWREVQGATVQGSSLSAPVTSFSYFVAAPPLTFMGIHRVWDVYKFYRFTPKALIAEGHSDSGEVYEIDELGPLYLLGGVGYPFAAGLVYSDATGGSYWAGATSPAGPGRFDAIGAAVAYDQVQLFHKRDEAATLSFLISFAELRALDHDPRAQECREVEGRPVDCKRLRGTLDVTVSAWDEKADAPFFTRDVQLTLVGSFGEWAAGPHSTTDVPLLDWRHMQLDRTGSTEAKLQLQDRLRIAVPLDTLQKGRSFTLTTQVRVYVDDRRQKESRMSAFFRDPQESGGSGIELEFTGLDRGDAHAQVPRPVVTAPAPACAGTPDPAAGTLEFESDTFSADEHEGEARGAAIFVTRSGGTRGRVSARVSTGGGTAVPGRHYTAIASHVAFADGHGGRRAIYVPIVTDQVAEPDRTLQLTLDDVRGCAALGATTAATLMLADDDTEPAAPASYRVGGTLSGLAGSGLVLEDRAQFVTLAPGADGSFQFDRVYAANAAYNVVVLTQPANPIQLCSVINGSGTVTANVSDIQVHCGAPPPTPSGLDPSFGSGGKASAGLAGGAAAITLQADGKIVAVGGATLARYHADGSLDIGFGAAGNVSNVFNGSTSTDGARDVAVQADGKIVVAGYARRTVGVLPATQDFAAARFNADGSRDTSFGIGGVAHVAFADSTDQAWQVLIQADGKIVLAGHAATHDPISGRAKNDFAVARLNADGSRDLAFAGDGRADFGTDSDFGYAAALQPDGRIVVAGRAGPVFINNNTPNSDPDVGLARYNADGSLDTTFGAGGTVREKLSQSWSEASDIVVQGDGKILVAVQAVEGSFFRYTLARFHADGRLDAGFGAGGTVNTAIGVGHGYVRALALQADGKIIVAGQVSTSNVNSDFGVVRYHADGTLDTAFGNGGVWVIDFFGGTDGVNDLQVQPDGRIVAAGVARNGSSNGIGLVRILP